MAQRSNLNQINQTKYIFYLNLCQFCSLKAEIFKSVTILNLKTGLRMITLTEEGPLKINTDLER